MTELCAMTWAGNLYRFYTTLQPPKVLPSDISWLLPHDDREVRDLLQRFLQRYYNDAQPRKLLLGINPGRFGAGVTGVNFTAPRQLTDPLGLEHSFKPQSELSAEFIYDMIAAFGGAEDFYGQFFIGSTSPLGFVKAGKNLNYYDDKALLEVVEPFIIKNIEQLLSFGVQQERGYCIGEDKNYKYLDGLNKRYRWFGELVPLPHPRFIMQYKRKQKEDFIRLYLERLGNKK